MSCVGRRGGWDLVFLPGLSGGELGGERYQDLVKGESPGVHRCSPFYMQL